MAASSAFGPRAGAKMRLKALTFAPIAGLLIEVYQGVSAPPVVRRLGASKGRP